MVMATENLARVASHHWIRHPHDRIFHAYLSSHPGLNSVCGQGKPFPAVREYDLPGQYSRCCAKCCEELYGTIGYRSPKSHEESK